MLVATIRDDLLLAAKNGEDCWEGTKAFHSHCWSLAPKSEKEDTDLQRGGKIFGVCSERKHEAVRPVQKRGGFENPATENQMTGLRVLGATGFVGFGFQAIARWHSHYMNS